MALTYDTLASYTVSGSSTTSVTFSSFSSSYTDLIIVAGSGGAKTNNDNTMLTLVFNNDTGSNYYSIQASGNGSAADVDGHFPETFMRIGRREYFRFYGNNTSAIINIMNYSNSSMVKQTLSTSSNPRYGVSWNSGLWNSTSAITSIKLQLTDSSFKFNDNTQFT